MSQTAEGLALAEDAARLDAKATLHADLRVPKVEGGQILGIRDDSVCQIQDKIFVTVIWDLNSAQNAAKTSAAMDRNYKDIKNTEDLQRPSLDRSIFDRLMR